MKSIRYLLITFICLFGFIIKYNALSINAPSSVYVGSNIAVTVDASGLTGRFDITSSNGGVIAGGHSEWLENNSRTFYFTAVGTGTAVITVNPYSVSDSNGNEYNSPRSITINVIERYVPEQIYINRTYSDNNFLSNLTIDGYELTPGFNKETLEYTVELIPGTEKINIGASLESDVASVRGSGEVEVTDGMNTINITVVAENGNERTYVIKAHMDEKDPIIVSMNKEEYTVIKKREYIVPKEGYEEIIVKINGFDIPALYNSITGNILVGMKDSNGDIKLYLYDSKKKEYSSFTEISFNGVNLFVLEDNNSIYKKVLKRISNVEIPVYELDKDNEKYLIYGTNTSTGNKGYYLYDLEENTVQRYDTKLLDKVNLEKDKYFVLIVVLSIISFITMVILLIQANKKNEE